MVDVIRTWNFRDSLKISGLPAAIYAGQSMCIQIAYVNLDSLVFNVVNQTKVLSTAIFVYLICNRRQSKVQCIALIILILSAFLVSGKSNSVESTQTTTFSIGLVCVLAASLSSGLASALSELALRKHNRNTYLFSAEISIYGIIAIALTLALDVNSERTELIEKGWTYGLTMWSIIPMFLQCLGGIIIGQVTKYAGGVMKGFSIIGGIVLTAVLRSLVDASSLTSLQLLSVPLVSLSLVLHAYFPPLTKIKKS